jgi:alpha-beta hydrolase superfamily lysophospholipase
MTAAATSARVRTSGSWISLPDLPPQWSPAAGWLSQPETPTDLGVVILPPVSYAYSSSHRYWRSLAEALARDGITALRVDYPGTGDSAGAAPCLSELAPWRSVLHGAVAELTKLGISRVAVVGGQLGGTFALMDGPQVAPTGIVAIAPVMSGRNFVRGMRMISIKAPDEVGGFAIGGYYFSTGLLDEISALSGTEPAGIPQLILPQDAGIAAFLASAAEDAVVDEQIVTTVADWIRSLAADDSPNHRPGAITAVEEFVGETATAMLYDDVVVHEQFVTVGPDQLVGVLTTPDQVTEIPDDVYVLVNSGSDPHTGPGRAWVELARYLATRDRATLRLDMRSWGESPDGPTVPGRPGDPHTVDDVVRLVDALNDGGRRRVVLGGLCSGAWTSLQAALDVEMAGLVVLNPQLYWEQGDPIEALMADTRARRMPEILQIKADAALGRWDDEDRRGLRPPAGVWLDDLVRLGRRASMVFAGGDDGLEYLEDRLARRLRAVTDSGVIRVVEMVDVDHAMNRSWQRRIVFDTIAAELDLILGAPR